MSGFDNRIRPRRLRGHPALRDAVREFRLHSDDLIAPVFVSERPGERCEIPSMPGVIRYDAELVLEEVDDLVRAGLRSVLLFGVPRAKDGQGSASHASDGAVQRAIRTIRSAHPELLVCTDVCLCEYTDHGHCGLIGDSADGRQAGKVEILNDETLEVLGRIAVSHADAGADVVAPSGMMDGMVGAIRGALDDAGFPHVAILSYAVKYASAFYGPFRDAAEGAPAFGDRRTHQMDGGNAREALREAELDVAEGADIIMIKPALPYLDVIARVRSHVHVPIAAYNVSGEYAMVKAAAAQGWLDERAAVLEALTGIRRAGADVIVTYHARDAARWMGEA
jgi:porphobilinogen synthase